MKCDQDLADWYLVDSSLLLPMIFLKLWEGNAKRVFESDPANSAAVKHYLWDGDTAAMYEVVHNQAVFAHGVQVRIYLWFATLALNLVSAAVGLYLASLADACTD